MKTLITTLLISFVLLSACQSDDVGNPEDVAEKSTPYTLTEEDNNLPLFGQITAVHLGRSPIQVDMEYLAIFDNEEDMGKAAIEDGNCTQEEVDDDMCFSNPFYLYLTGEKETLTIADDARIVVFAFNSDCGYEMIEGTSDLYMEQISADEWIDFHNADCNLPLYHFSQENGEIKILIEQYIP